MRGLALIAALVIALTVPVRAARDDVVRMGLNPAVLAYLPVLIAIDRGYFKQQHIDLQLTPNPGSAMVQLPLLARGDLDVAPMVMAPAFLNQLKEGFNVKLIAAGQGSHAGWNDNSWIVVREDLWDSGAVRKPADLRGKVVDGLTAGGPPNMLLMSLLASAGLTTSEMTYTEKLRTAADELAAFRNHAIDVAASFEPGASVLQVQRVAHKWISVHDVIPWLQETFLAASAPFLRDHRRRRAVPRGVPRRRARPGPFERPVDAGAACDRVEVRADSRCRSGRGGGAGLRGSARRDQQRIDRPATGVLREPAPDRTADRLRRHGRHGPAVCRAPGASRYAA